MCRSLKSNVQANGLYKRPQLLHLQLDTGGVVMTSAQVAEQIKSIFPLFYIQGRSSRVIIDLRCSSFFIMQTDYNSFHRRDRFYHLSFQTISQTRNILLITKLLQSKQKIKYLLISLHISLFGCIFGCQFSNTPNYEYQKKHHFRTGKPEEKRCANHRECAYPYACDIRKPAYRVYNGLPH